MTMIFRIACDQFAQALARLQDFITKNSPDYLANVLIEATNDGFLKLTATDLEISFHGLVKAEFISEPGSVLLDGKKLYSIVKALPSELVSIEVTGYSAVISYGSKASKVTLNGLNPESYPKVGQIEEELSFIDIESTPLGELFKKTLFSVSTEEARPRLTGVHFESGEDGYFQAVSTDGHRLSLAKRRLTEGNTKLGEIIALIPRKGIATLTKLLEGYAKISFAFNKSDLLVKTSDFTVFIRLIDESFPDYRAIIPKNNENEFEFPVAELKNTLKRASILLDKNDEGIRLAMSDNTLLIEYQGSTSSFSEKIDMTNISSSEYAISFKLKYLLDILNSVEAPIIKAYFGKTETNPAIFKDPSHPDDLYILMARRS
jgi:DNA polymerase-3 subunit beta